MACPASVRVAAASLVILVILPACTSLRAPTLSHSMAGPGAQLVRSESGLATLFPLQLTHQNLSAIHRLRLRHGRELIGADAQMKLFDDLLNKGYYTGELFIGTPPQKFALIVDTGSTVTYVPCSTCKHCGSHQDASFDPSHSSSYNPIPCGDQCTRKYMGQHCDNGQCKYERLYAEMSSSSGVLGSDLVGFGDQSDLPPQSLVFGCENDEQGDLFKQKADGIMGLGRGPLSIVDQLVDQGAISNSFSLCYGGMLESGGAMVLGAMTPPPEMIFVTSDAERSTYYNLPLEGIRVGGQLLPLNPSIFNGRHGTVLDSGTTYCYLPGTAFDAFVQGVTQRLDPALKRVDGPDPNDFPDICFADAGVDPSKLSDYFPTVELVFNGNSVVSLAPENYLFRHITHRGAYCLGFFKNDKDPTTLIGGIVVRNMLVMYDRGNKRIGFWRTKCTDLSSQLTAAMAPPATSPPIDAGVSPGIPSQVIPPVLAPSPPQVGPALDNSTNESSDTDFPSAIASLDMDLSLKISSSDFAALESAFVEDMSRELELLASQVEVLDTYDDGNHVNVHWAIVPEPSSSYLSTSSAETIVSELVSHRVVLRNEIGVYQLTSWKLQPLGASGKTWAPKDHTTTLIAVVASLVLVTVSIVGVACLYYRLKNRNTAQYVSIDEVDEKGELEPL